ncbi:MAG: DNA-binding response regulator [Legionellaceae bacterium]|nr:DNA-binding response regulator [Legionellaceae bacterium]
MNKDRPIIYVVDDDRSMAQSIRWLIESVGLHVEIFDHPKQFLAQYNADHHGCLILDVRMPEMGGLEVQSYLKKQGIDIPIIFITGHGDVPMAIRAMKGGAVEFLTKPFNDQALLDSINNAIELDAKRRRKRQRRESIETRIKRLTPREREVMTLVVAGKLNKVIAAELHISSKTVELHRSKIMEKMEARSLAELVKLVVTYQANQNTSVEA